MKYDCDGCKQPLGTWDYRYHGNHYCRQCCDRLFKINTCSICGKSKKIFIDLAVPVCKICQVKGKPCIRCGKIEYTPGKITAIGPVCNSCSKYFREYRTCSACSKTSNSVSNRTLSDGTVKLICSSCYNKTLPICYRCGKQRKAYSYDEEGHPVCHICTIESERICIQCGASFPAGKGRICSDCTYQNSYLRRLTSGRNVLSVHMSELFVMFGAWLVKRRGIQYAVVSIFRYLKYFARLDHLAREIERIPNYAEVVERLTVQATRANLLVTVFLDQTKRIPIDKVIQEEYSNLDMIDRYLERFEEGTWAKKVIDGYFEYLHTKAKDKAMVRSIRLAVGTAANFLSYAKWLHEHIVSTTCLHGYLWKYPGQRDSIIGFINYLNRAYRLNIKMPSWKHPELSVPKQSQMHLKQVLIDLLRLPYTNEDYTRRLIRTSISYLHGVDIPENVYMHSWDLKKNRIGDIFIRIAGRRFYLPREILRK